MTQLLTYEDRTADFPALLEAAFPEGLPEGLELVDGKAGLYLFAGEDGNHPTLHYRVEAAADGGRAATLSFSYVGGGGINHCDWTSLSRQWTCNGYM